MAKQKAKADKTNAKIEKMKAEEELRLLFSDAIHAGKTVKQKAQIEKDKHAAAGGGGGGAGTNKASDHYDDAWAEAQLANGMMLDDYSGEKPLELRIEEQVR